MPIQESDILNALSGILEHSSGQDLVQLGLIRTIDLGDDDVRVTLDHLPLPPADREHLLATCRQAIATQMTIDPSRVAITMAPPAEAPPRETLPGVKHVIAVGAGKGGVGKSTVSTMLALGLARRGASCGLLDGDIYGPSMATMLGLDNLEPTARGNTLMPFDVHGIKAMTIAKLVDPEKPMIWRGPMAHKAFSQLLLQTDWGNLDALIVDLPPGTGDVPLSLSQALPLTGAVIVCTPQRVAQDDARRAVRMFGELNVPILGVVENMSWFIADDQTYDLFGRGGAENMAKSMGLPFLGPLPLHIDMRKHADAGTPGRNFEICDEITDALDALAANLTAQISAAPGLGVMPSISVS